MAQTSPGVGGKRVAGQVVSGETLEVPRRWTLAGLGVDAASHGRQELTVPGRCAQRRPGHPGAWLCSHWGSEPGGELGYRDTLKKEQAA